MTDLSLRLTEGSARATGMALSAFSEPGGGMIFFLGRGDDLLDQVRQFTSAEGDKIYIFSRKGYMLTTLADPLDLTNKAAERIEKSFGALPEWFTVQTEDHNRRGRHLVAYSAIPGLSGLRPDGGVSSPWALLISYDMENFLSPLARLFWATLIAASVWMLALLGISVVAARRVVGPVKQLRHQAEQMTSGQLDSRAQVHSGDEIQDLAEAFNTMADRLSASHRDLEARVEESRLRAEHINVINEITKAITQDPDIGRTFEILKRDLKKILQYDGLWIALNEEETGKLKVTHAEPAALLPHLQDDRLALEYSFHGPTVREKITSAGEIDPTQDTDSFDSGIFVSLDFKSYLVAPLPSVNRVLGALTVVSKDSNAFSKEAKEILSSVASTVAVSIELAELLERTRKFARELEVKVEERTKELNQATKKLIQTEKYAATGRMGANLAHEINNPLGIIKNYLRLVSDGLQQSGGGRRATDPNLAHLTIINEEINRIARIVRQLLDLHRPPEQTSLRTDIAALLSDLVALMEKDLETSGIKINCIFESDLPRPLVAPDLMRQVFINLMRNAQDAMENGGEMTIEVSACGHSDGQNERPSLCVSIGDTGTGIDQQHLAQIFDPFFTTKASDKGTGLGLSVSYGIVQMYQGTIEAESEPGKGTKMIVTIPVDPPARQDESAALRTLEENSGESPGKGPAGAERPPSSPVPSV